MNAVALTIFVVLTSTTLDLRLYPICGVKAPYCNSFTKIYHIDNFINNIIFACTIISFTSIIVLSAGISIAIITACVPVIALTMFKYMIRLIRYVYS